MFIVNYRKIFYALSLVLVAISIGSFFVWGLTFGIDFTGGSLIEVAYTDVRPDVTAVKVKLDTLALPEYSLRQTGDKGYLLRLHYIDQKEHDNVLQALKGNGAWPLEEKRFDSVGPTIGAELRGKAILSIAMVIFAIVLFITFAFRQVSEPVSSWKYGLIAIVALLHDVIIPTGAFSLLGHFLGYEVDALFITALLVVLGFSIHDTIVVFDRVRENLKVNREAHRKEEFATTVGKSIAQTFTRSINTSFTTVLALLALYFLGSEATRHFSLALLIGIVAGTYSSVFLGSPLLVTVEKWQNRGKN